MVFGKRNNFESAIILSVGSLSEKKNPLGVKIVLLSRVVDVYAELCEIKKIENFVQNTKSIHHVHMH